MTRRAFLQSAVGAGVSLPLQRLAAQHRGKVRTDGKCVIEV